MRELIERLAAGLEALAVLIIVGGIAYPVKVLLVATVLVMVPYLLIRGPANRMTRRKQ